jgi:hypothetical protein
MLRTTRQKRLLLRHHFKRSSRHRYCHFRRCCINAARGMPGAGRKGDDKVQNVVLLLFEAFPPGSTTTTAGTVLNARWDVSPSAFNMEIELVA